MMRKASVTFIAGLLWATATSANSIGAEHDAPYEICALCHSLDGVSRMAKFPRLAGLPASYIEKQLHDFLSGRRINDGGQMSAIVTEITPDDFPVVAEWFASQTAPIPDDAGDVSAGMEAFDTLGCVNCHASQRANNMTPHLTAQHAAYLKKQMLDFREGRRTNDPGRMMQATMANLSDAQIAELAAYLATTARESP